MTLNKTNTAILFSLIAISACTSNEVGQSKDVAQDKIYQEYSVKYAEGDENVNVHAQFRFAGSNGTTLVLSAPSQVAFDNEVINVDSSGAEGAYYQVRKSVANFYGKHHFIFTDINNKKFDNDFSFDTFRLLNVPASVSKKQGLNLSFEYAALQPGDVIKVSSVNTDSSFIITYEPSATHSINIPAKELMRQKKGDMKLETTLYRKIDLQQNTAEGGEMELRYTLKPITVKLEE